MACEARQYSDQMSCGRCGLAWDVNDPDPPVCKRATDRRAIQDRRVTKAAILADERFVFHSGGAAELAAMRGRFVATATAQVPVELPEPLALELAQAYEQARGRGLGGIEAMRSAYRLFLDRLP